MYGSTSPKPAAWPVRGVTRPILIVSVAPPPPLFFTPPHAASRPLEATVRPAPPAAARNDLRVIADDSGRISSDNAVLLSPSPYARRRPPTPAFLSAGGDYMPDVSASSSLKRKPRAHRERGLDTGVVPRPTRYVRRVRPGARRAPRGRSAVLRADRREQVADVHEVLAHGALGRGRVALLDPAHDVAVLLDDHRLDDRGGDALAQRRLEDLD